MIIDKSAMYLSSSHSLQENTAEKQRLLFWTGHASPALVAGTSQPADLEAPTDILEISQAARQVSIADNTDEYADLSPEDESKLRTLQALLEALTGKKLRLVIPRLGKEQTGKKQMLLELRNNSAQQTRAGWGLEYDFSRTRSEQEKLSFQTTGIVKTADGREIKISLELNMSRAFYSHEEFHVRAGDAVKIDPLVINFDAPAATLTSSKFSFDLDADGSREDISFLNAGSGFLALDLNEDGLINDGTELFGPSSGDGFAELAAYDADGNNWIDENDPVWDRLRIWTKDADGQDILLALGAKGIGAIYLGSVDTSFALKDASNQQHGQLRSSSVFLRENGTAGTVQQLDLMA